MYENHEKRNANGTRKIFQLNDKNGNPEPDRDVLVHTV